MKKILIAENDLAMGMTYLRVFVVNGFEVEQVNGEIKAAHAASQFRPDIAIVSMEFPGSKSIRIIENLSNEARRRPFPILAYARNNDRHLAETALTAGATECIFFGKPGTTDLHAKVAQILGLPSRNMQPNATAAPASVLPAEPSKVKPPTPAPPPPVEASKGTPPADAPKQAAQNPSPPPNRTKPSVKLPIADGSAGNLIRLKARAQNFLRTEDKSVKPLIAELYETAGILTRESTIPRSRSASRMLAALFALLKDMAEDPDVVSASIRRTILQAADFVGATFNSPANPDEQEERNFRILAVDDEVIARMLVARALESVHLAPETAENPMAALELVKTTRFDLFILDIQMPQMTGFELCQQIRRQPFNSKTPVIFVTSVSDFKSRIRFAQSGGDDFIAKPFVGTELATKALLHLMAR